MVVAKKKVHRSFLRLHRRNEETGARRNSLPWCSFGHLCSGLEPPSDDFSVTENNEFEMKREVFLGESFVISKILTFPTL
jgi:hypothetical protein